MKWAAPAKPQRSGCLLAIPGLLLALPMAVLGPLANDGTQWGNDPTPEQRQQDAFIRAEQRRQAKARRADLARRLRGIRRRRGRG